MEFKRWESIRNVGHDQFINEPQDLVLVTEKLDGMNVSVTDEYVAGRNGPLKASNFGYRGWAKEGSRIQGTKEAEQYLLFGEWLVFHTVEYKEEFLNKFYLFSAIDKETGKEVSFSELQRIAKVLGVQTPTVLFEGTYEEFLESQDEIVGQSEMTLNLNEGEGVVILNLTKGFRTKIVTPRFKEVHKVSFKEEKMRRINESEIWAHEYGTPARITKILHKLLDEEILFEQDLTTSNFGRIQALLLEHTYQDMVNETPVMPEFFMYASAEKVLSRTIALTLRELFGLD